MQLGMGIVFGDAHETLAPALVINGACNTDRLMRGTKMRVGADLHSNVAT